MNVHAALDRFMRADDFLEGKRVVEELQGTLLSQEGLAYLKKQLENVEPDTPLAQVIGMKAGEKYDEKRVQERHRDHALFIAYAPADDPKIALALLVENGGHGSSTAAPIAREVFDYHILGKRPERKQALGQEESESD